MTALKFQFGVRSLFVFTSFAAVIVFGFIYNVLLAFAAISVAGGFLGGTFLGTNDHSGLTGASSGGAIAGTVWVVAHLVIGYTLASDFEDSGVGFTGTLLFLWPYGLFIGAAIGSASWFFWSKLGK